MSRIEELIREKCPDGVERKTLGETCIIKTGAGITKKDATEDGLFPIISGGVEPLGMYNKTNRKANTVTIARAGGAGYVNYITTDFYLNDKCFSVIPSDSYADKINSRFLYYVLKNDESGIMNMKSTGSVPTVNTQKVSRIVIPIPPISIQEEIVKVLDLFTKLETELESKLAVELESRRKQYEYYRDQLLSFDNLSADGQQVEYVSILDVADSFTGLTYRPTDVTRDGSGTLVLRSSNIKNGLLSFDDCVRVNMYNIPDRAVVRGGDTLICVRNGSKALVGKSVFIDALSERMAFGAFMSILRSKDINRLNPKYLSYIWQTTYEKARQKNDDSMPINQITQRDFGKIQIPVPLDIKVQERVVSILDALSDLTKDIMIDLPIEIEGRRKQYEYYRNKLLTFENKTA